MEKYNDPNDEEHEEMVKWGTDQGFTDYDIDAVNEELKDKDYTNFKN